MDVLALEEEGMQDFREIDIVSVFVEGLQLNALKLVHEGKDHD